MYKCFKYNLLNYSFISYLDLSNFDELDSRNSDQLFAQTFTFYEH